METIWSRVRSLVSGGIVAEKSNAVLIGDLAAIAKADAERARQEEAACAASATRIASKVAASADRAIEYTGPTSPNADPTVQEVQLKHAAAARASASQRAEIARELEARYRRGELPEMVKDLRPLLAARKARLEAEMALLDKQHHVRAIGHAAVIAAAEALAEASKVETAALNAVGRRFGFCPAEAQLPVAA
jgi:hypothetical protein